MPAKKTASQPKKTPQAKVQKPTSSKSPTPLKKFPAPKKGGIARRDLSGEVFGNLHVVKLDFMRKQIAYWECICGLCGKKCIKATGSILRSVHQACQECSRELSKPARAKFIPRSNTFNRG